MKLNMLKYTEIREYLKEKDSLLIPIGTCEQMDCICPCVQIQ